MAAQCVKIPSKKFLFTVSYLIWKNVSLDKLIRVMKETGYDAPLLYKETGTGALAKYYMLDENIRFCNFYVRGQKSKPRRKVK